MEEKKILSELKKGNKEAFKEFYRKYSLEMHEFAFSFLKDRKDAEDVVQDAFVVMINRHDTWQYINDMRYYMLRIVQNQCLAKIRKQESLSKKENAYNYYKISSSGVATTPEVIVSINNKENIDKVNWIFSFLSPQRRKVVELIYMEGKSYAEAATIMGIGIESIRTHLRLARNILKSNFSSLIYFISFLMISR